MRRLLSLEVLTTHRLLEGVAQEGGDQYHRPLILGGFAPERTRRRVPESDRSVGNSLTNLTRHGRLLTYSTYGMQL